jgi:hypothetical protein
MATLKVKDGDNSQWWRIVAFPESVPNVSSDGDQPTWGN